MECVDASYLSPNMVVALQVYLGFYTKSTSCGVSINTSTHLGLLAGVT